MLSGEQWLVSRFDSRSSARTGFTDVMKSKGIDPQPVVSRTAGDGSVSAHFDNEGGMYVAEWDFANSTVYLWKLADAHAVVERFLSFMRRNIRPFVEIEIKAAMRRKTTQQGGHMPEKQEAAFITGNDQEEQ